tara:strand:- start:401 stop:811 length:411 start_codon:yes stop_codon:yes gene_type:complete
MITPKYLLEDEIYSHVEDLVLNGINCYNDLKLDEKFKISSLIIKKLKGDDFESLAGSDNCNETMAIFAEALANNDYETDQKLLKYIKMNAVINHGYQVNELIDEIKDRHNIARHLDNNDIPYTDQQTGELLWRRSA